MFGSTTSLQTPDPFLVEKNHKIWKSRRHRYHTILHTRSPAMIWQQAAAPSSTFIITSRQHYCHYQCTTVLPGTINNPRRLPENLPHTPYSLSTKSTSFHYN